MTKFGKCLVLFAVAASFAFFGFAWVSLKGGPNWDAEAAAMGDYSFQRSEDGRWTVTERETQKAVSVASPTVAAAAIVAARKDLEERQQKEIASLKKETEDYGKTVVEVRKFNEADSKALQSRVEELNRQLQDLNARILKLSNDVVKRSQEAQAIRTEATKRREDVYRLTRELDEIRADRYRSDQLQTRLRDRLERLNGAVVALESRNQQLRAAASASDSRVSDR